MDPTKTCMRIVGVYLTICILGLVVALFCLWPRGSVTTPQVMDPNTPAVQRSVSDPNSTEGTQPGEIAPSDSGSQKSDSTDSLVEQCPISGLRFVVLVVIMGALGACLHGITSLAYYRGRCEFSEKWTLWYLYRPFVGGVLALIFYLIISGGLMPPVNGNNKKFFVLLGLSGLMGLFSKQALNKLSLIFDTIFASDKEHNEKLSKTPKNTGTQPVPNSQGDTVTDETTTKEKPPKKAKQKRAKDTQL